MSEPLDLRALEARLKFGDSLDAAECGALVAALRMHHAALQDAQEFVGVLGDEPFPWKPDARLTFQTTAGMTQRAAEHLEHIRGVLASCTDHEGAK